MKKVLLLSLLIFSLSGCGTQSTEAPQNQDIQPSSTEEDVTLDQELQAQIQQQAEIKKQNDEAYEAISDGEITLAKCDNFADENSKNSCKDMFYFDLAMQQKDSSQCQNIKEETNKEVCLLESGN